MAAGAAIMALFYGIRRSYRAVRAIEEILEGVRENAVKAEIAVQTTEALARAVEDIRKEVRPNGGSSLKDTVNRIDRRVAVLEAIAPSHERITQLEATSRHP